MALFKFTAQPKWGFVRVPVKDSIVIEADNIHQARAKARLLWANQGRLPNNTKIKIVG